MFKAEKEKMELVKEIQELNNKLARTEVENNDLKKKCRELQEEREAILAEARDIKLKFDKINSNANSREDFLLPSEPICLASMLTNETFDTKDRCGHIKREDRYSRSKIEALAVYLDATVKYGYNYFQMQPQGGNDSWE